jgi:hypothetical protein
MGGLEIMVVNLGRIKPSQSKSGGESSLYNLIFMSVNQQIGFMRADLTGLAYIYALLWGIDIPWVH